MSIHGTTSAEHENITQSVTSPKAKGQFPYWLLLIIAYLLYMGWQIIDKESYQTAFNYIVSGSPKGFSEALEKGVVHFLWRGQGIILSVRVAIIAFIFSMVFGLLAGLGRISNNPLIRTLATTYIEFIRGIPVLVLLLTFGFSLLPDLSQRLGLGRSGFSMELRATITLAIIYGAFIAEVFRAGIESVPKGQNEAARSLGMTSFQTLFYVTLPQAIRNVLPALGNDFIALLKDSSLVSALAVSDITQLSRLYVGSTFRFRESYLVLTFLYLTMTVALSLLQQWYAKRLQR